jgi:hypothetical protein
VAFNTQNPRILSIKLTSFRHWGGTMLAWLSNGNTLFVKDKLGHRRVDNTMKYIKKINWKINQDFEVVTATTDEEIKKCGEAGYQKYDERTVGATHVSYYRRPRDSEASEYECDPQGKVPYLNAENPDLRFYKGYINI